MIEVVIGMIATVVVVDLGLYVWHDIGGVRGSRARDAERRRIRQLAERHPARARRHGA